MNILVVGGTGLIGSHITKNLLENGHSVTIATRGARADAFGGRVGRVVFDRQNPQQIAAALAGKVYDVVYDTQAYSSNEVKYLLDAAKCSRYIEVSTVSVYAPNFKLGQPEGDFDPLKHPLKWCNRTDFDYGEIKRQAECAMYQAYGHIPSVAVRLPFVVGTDDDTRRLHFYVKNILARKPMFIDNMDARLSFILSCEAGRFIAWLADRDICGPVNAGSRGEVSLAEIIAYVEGKTGIKAVLCDDGEKGAYNGCPSYGMDLSRVGTVAPTEACHSGLDPESGFSFSRTCDWMPALLDQLIQSERNV